VVEPLVLRLTLQRQAEQEVKKARHPWGNVPSGAASLGNQKKGVGRPIEILARELQHGDRLTARPKHSDFRERISLRGEIKERRSSVEVDTSRNSSPGFS
jgi:hypothetical protein